VVILGLCESFIDDRGWPPAWEFGVDAPTLTSRILFRTAPRAAQRLQATLVAAEGQAASLPASVPIQASKLAPDPQPIEVLKPAVLPWADISNDLF
jgi:hypothetical protein